MSTEAQYEVTMIPMSEIFVDPTFNCRGEFPMHEIVDLARDIKNRGLDSPVTVRPWDKDGFKYHLIAGHRRHAAFKFDYYNGDTVKGVPPGMIPAFVRANVDETEARRLNLRENLHRKNLNPVQEARALKYFLDCKGPLGHALFTDAELAEVFGQSRGWVQNRRQLLELPLDIQAVAASGLLTTDHVKKLVKMTHKDQCEFVRKIKDAALKNEKLDLTPSVKRASDAFKVRARKKEEIQEMGGMIYDIIGPNIASRLAAWACAHISTIQLLESIKEYCKEHGLEYKEPDFLKKAVSGTAA